MNRKRGSLSLTIPIVFVIVTVMLIIIFSFMVNTTLPLIYYEKIDNIATRYMFVIEKFGYLTTAEKNQMIDDLKNAGIDETKITLVYPKAKIGYGEPTELTINYSYSYKLPILGNNNSFTQNKETIISVKKNSFSKIY